MGYRLYREVVEHGPSDLSLGEFVVWTVIADDANDDTRTGWIASDALCRRSRMTRSAVVKNLQRLAARGYELRVPRGTDRLGREVFAYRGTQSTYRLPALADAKDGRPSTQSTRERVDDGAPIVEKGWTTVRERVDDGPRKGGPSSTPSPQSPQYPQQQRASAAERTIQTRLGCTAGEAAAVAAEITTRRPEIRSLPAVLPCIDDNELRDYYAETLATAAAQAEVERRAAAARCKTCTDKGFITIAPGAAESCPDCKPSTYDRAHDDEGTYLHA
ncbi:hypothetical protein DLJ47_34495 [Micromonospora sp. S4605]|uniref:helix-turn-helix domain-containing protein n=1 Tax=Micromonospora sp. S4605 TaxID=1420897 RepID=UPI000D6F2099|nr:helix-turn-helix domain-containing protein [Micromonospora sp. S4605]PWU45491.1 hypothetical protein DLJ47_34495 [Micromonospora sp. S4605]